MKKGCVVLILAFSAVFLFTWRMPVEAQETTKESEIIKMLQGGQKVLVCFYEPSDPEFGDVKASLKTIGNNFKGMVGVVYVNSADTNERKFTEQFMSQSGYISVFVFAPPRAIVAELRGSEITKTNLMRALFPPRKSSGGCGCSGGKTCGG